MAKRKSADEGTPRIRCASGINFSSRKQKNKFKVRMKGLEPPRLAAPDPKSGSATNYDTSAKEGQR